MPSFSLLTVKYLKEVIPYFRKASILSEIGWTFTGSEFLQNSTNPCSESTNNSHKSDTKTVPLMLCHLTKCVENKSNNGKYEENNNLIVMYSPNRQSKCVLRCADSAQCNAWFSAIHSACCQLTAQAVLETNRLLSDFLDGARLTHMGWLFEKVIHVHKVLIVYSNMFLMFDRTKSEALIANGIQYSWRSQTETYYFSI